MDSFEGKSLYAIRGPWVILLSQAVRVFVESVLRYGLPASFVATVVKPHRKCEEKVRALVLCWLGEALGVAFPSIYVLRKSLFVI